MVRLSPEEISHQQELLATHHRTLAHLMKQAAHFSAGHLPAHIANGIDEARDEIAQIKAVLREAGVAVADHLDDVPGSVVSVSRLPQKEHRNRQAMIEKVRLTWIDGVLKKSLFNEAVIALDLAERDGVVQRPYEIVRCRPNQKDTVLPAETRIMEVFDAQSGALLILGVPGSGKTTLLLELARDLLDRAAEDDGYPIPVVFNLSSWAETRMPLEAWLVDELNRQYDVPRKSAQAWVDVDAVLPLLDGLDEVAEGHRLACITAINVFRQEHGFLPLVVCCREAEYGVLPELRLHGAVVVQPLTQMQVRHYLQNAEAPLEGLRAALENDAALWELLDTPLMLAVVALTYSSESPAKLRRAKTLEERRQRLFDDYVQAMFDRLGRSKGTTRYSQQQIVWWLSKLARHMMHRNQTVFHIEHIQPDMLKAGVQHRLYYAGVAISVAVANGLAFGLLNGATVLQVSIIITTVFVFCLLLNSTVRARLDNIKIVEGIDWDIPRIVENSGMGFMRWFIVGLNVAPIIIAFADINTPIELTPIGVFAVAIAMALTGGLTRGLVEGSKVFEQSIRTRPNQGIWLSAKYAVRAWLICGVLWGMLLGVAISFSLGLVRGVLHAANTFLFVGFLFGLKYGGLTCLQHVVLRFVVWLTGFTPMNYRRFLDHCADRIFLRKVGGGYIFVHHLLLEYFASLHESASLPTKKYHE